MREKQAQEAFDGWQALYWKPTICNDRPRTTRHVPSQGTVISAKVMADGLTGRSRRFGFVEKSTQEEAEQASNALHGTDF
jgi:hypothetical protein